MKQLLGEYVGDNDRQARVMMDDVGMISVQLWDNGILLNEITDDMTLVSNSNVLAIEDWIGRKII